MTKSPPPKHPCALCAANLATGFPANCPPEQARFTRDQRICDACLATGFSGSPIAELNCTFFRAYRSIGMLVTFTIGGIMLLRRRYHGWTPMLILFGATIVAGYAFAYLMRLAMWLWLAWRQRQYVRQNPADARAEGERFYYLAQWATLTNHPAFAKKMLRQSKQMHFIPPDVAATYDRR